MGKNTITLEYGCPMCQQQGTQGKFSLQPITINRALNAPKDFECPQCGTHGHYQFRQWEGKEHIQWAFDNSLRFQYVYDCPGCGGKLTEYVRIGMTADHSVCRRCGKTRNGNLAGYR
jgi:DNA-directed RNA polymerase subunit RPC12/RpoP